MKKILPLLLLSSLFIISCRDPDEKVVERIIENHTIETIGEYPKVIDHNESLAKYKTDYFGLDLLFPKELETQDIVLVYRKSNSFESNPVWVPLPKSYFYNNGEMDYSFNFTRKNLKIDLNADFDITKNDQTFLDTYINNQTFRIVLVPAVYGRSADSVDPSTLSYEEVIKKYNIDDSKVGTL